MPFNPNKIICFGGTTVAKSYIRKIKVLYITISQTGGAMILENNINKVLEYKDDTSYVTTLYLKLGPDERNDFQYKRTLKNLIKESKKNYSYLESDIKKYKSIE